MANNDRKYALDTKVAVLCGGLSSEREVSLRSGKNVFEALKRLGYTNVELVDVDKKKYSNLKEVVRIASKKDFEQYQRNIKDKRDKRT